MLKAIKVRKTRILLIFSFLLNVFLIFMLIQRTSRQAPMLPISASGWLHQPAVDSFKRIPVSPGSIAFVGDSLTAEGPWGELFGPWLNRGVKGDTIEGVYSRIQEITERKPAYIFLMIGINDLIRGKSIQVMIENFSELIQEIKSKSPTSLLFVLSLLPIDEERFNTNLTNDKIRETNKALENAANEYSIKYINLHDVFVNKYGMLRSELSYDGIHLTTEGYLIWRDILREYLY